MKITRDDIDFLYALYRLRCLSFSEIHRFFYTDKNCYKEKIIPFVKTGLASFHHINGEYSLMIRQKGIDLVQKYRNIPSEIFNTETRRYEKSILKEKDISVEDKFAPHQIALNEFVLGFRKKYGKIHYFDEKFLSGIANMRPDGMIRLEHTDLYLEQDMGTETVRQLRDKWNRYRRYLSTEYDGSRKITVLFIIKCQKAEERELLVRRIILETFEQMTNFEIYVGTCDEMLKACFERIVPGDKIRTKNFSDLMRHHKFRISDGSKLKVRLGGTVYRYYFGAYDKNNHLIYYSPNRKRKGRFAEFLADDSEFSPMSIFSKISFHDKNSHNFDIAYSPRANLRLIGYIVLTNDIQGLYKKLRACELLGIRNVFYTTPDRLMRMPLPKALLQFRDDGSVYSCNDYYFEPVNKIGSIYSLFPNGLAKI